MPSRASTTAPQKAGRKPFTRNPRTMLDASRIIRALMTRRKIPSVTMLRGKVTILRKKPRVAFSSQITSAAIMAGQSPSTVKPETTPETTSRAQA